MLAKTRIRATDNAVYPFNFEVSSDGGKTWAKVGISSLSVESRPDRAASVILRVPLIKGTNDFGATDGLGTSVTEQSNTNGTTG